MFTRTALLANATLMAVALVSATQASAHAKLVSSDPAANATVAAPKAITLTFDEELTPAFSGFDVMLGGSMKMPVKTTVSADHKAITGVLSGPVMAGTYKISWHAAAADDGHKTMGTFSFNVK
jgi:methionine-rich copper-binding protein CopC